MKINPENLNKISEVSLGDMSLNFDNSKYGHLREKNVNIFIIKLNIVHATVYFYKHTIEAQVCQISKHLNQKLWLYALFNTVTQQNKVWENWLICTPTPRYILSISLYIFLSGYNSGTIQDIKFKFSAFLSFVKATKCAKIQCAGCTGFKVGIFKMSPIKGILDISLFTPGM